jgi:hypothetical protein
MYSLPQFLFVVAALAAARAVSTTHVVNHRVAILFARKCPKLLAADYADLNRCLRHKKDDCDCNLRHPRNRRFFVVFLVTKSSHITRKNLRKNV